MRLDHPGQDDPAARAWRAHSRQHPTIRLLPASSLDTSWSVCDITCLLSDSSGRVQDETRTCCRDVWGSKALCILRVHVPLTGAGSMGKAGSAPMCLGEARSRGGYDTGGRQPCAPLRWQQSAKASDPLPLSEGELCVCRPDVKAGVS